MNRLLRIGFDTFLTSVTPILGWFLLGILVDKKFNQYIFINIPDAICYKCNTKCFWNRC